MRAPLAVWGAQLTHAESARRCLDHAVYSGRSARGKKEASPTGGVARVGCLVCESLDREMPDTFHSVDGKVARGPEGSLEHLVAELSGSLVW